MKDSMPHDPEIVILADPRFPGGSTRALLAEARGLANAGMSAGFCPVMGPILRQSRPFHPDLRPFLEDGTLVLVDPRRAARARLAIVHHPSLFTHLPPEPFGLSAAKVVLVLHHPPFGGTGLPEYDLAGIVRNLDDTFAADVLLAPVGPAVRRQLAPFVGPGVGITATDWLNLIDFADWPMRQARPDEARIVIGRHSRAQASKFPATREDALQVYPEVPGMLVRFLGFPDDLRDTFAPLPANWECYAFGSREVRDFLAGLDYFVYYHAPEWVEAFGYAILEAIACGVPAILPPEFEALFGPAAIYATPEEVSGIIAGLEADPDAYAAHVRAARDWAEERFSVDNYLPRLAATVPGWRGQPVGEIAGKIAEPAPLRVVMMTSNGVGLGHLTRLLAIAGRLPDGVETSFFTLSQAFQLAIEAGYLTQYVPFYRVTGAVPDIWNRALTEELADFLDLTRPDILVFDGNAPYQGMLSALEVRRGIARVWVRRGFWAAENRDLIQRAAAFDLVIEPGELAGRFDTGATATADAVRTAPILHIAAADRLDRDAARAELGLGGAALQVGMMLGAGTNFDLTGIRSAILDHLSTRPDVEVTEFAPPIAENGSGTAGGHRRVEYYPAARIAAGFDLMICGAGYNSFHEMMVAGIPAVFVPNEAAEMDRQVLRARYATQIGCATMLRASDRIGVGAVLDRALDPGARAEMRRRMARFRPGDGAAEAAGLIVDYGRMTRMRQGFPD